MEDDGISSSLPVESRRPSPKFSSTQPERRYGLPISRLGKKDTHREDDSGISSMELVELVESEVPEVPEVPVKKKRHRSHVGDHGSKQKSTQPLKGSQFSNVKEAYEILRPIAQKWKHIGFELKLDLQNIARIQASANSNEERLEQMLTQHHERALDKQSLYNAVSGPLVTELEIARKILSHQQPARREERLALTTSYRPAQLSGQLQTPPQYSSSQSLKMPALYTKAPLIPPPASDIKAIELMQEFSKLLLHSISCVNLWMPKKLANMLSCHNSRFTTLTRNCRDTSDVIKVLEDNITFIDYDLLTRVADETKNESLTAEIETYVEHLNEYLRSKIQKRINPSIRLKYNSTLLSCYRPAHLARKHKVSREIENVATTNDMCAGCSSHIPGTYIHNYTH